jgi:hypothetical protein
MQLQVTKKSANTETPTSFDTALSCGYCGRVFKRESTIQSHTCENKRRWLEKDRPGNRIAFSAFSRFYKFNTNTKKPKTHDDYIKSTYYLAFSKFGSYCADSGVINVDRYVDWLLRNQIKITDWPSDNHYQRYLTEYLRQEDALSAVARSIECLIKLCEGSTMMPCDYLRWGNSNRICHEITAGRISPWLLYNSNSGREFLDGLNGDQVRVVFDYINPELWALQFKRMPDVAEDVKSLLSRGGF